LEDWQVVIEVFAFEGVGNDGLVLDTDLIAETPARERLNGSLELPRRRVRRGKRKVPGNVVLENRGLSRIEGVAHPRQLDESIDVGKDTVGRDPEDGDCRLHRL